MATPTRFSHNVIGAEVDILGGLSYDRIFLRFCGSFTPCAYNYGPDGVTHVINDAGQWDVTPVGGGYTFWPTLMTIFGMEQAALQAIRADPAMSIDTAQTSEWEALKNSAFTTWDQMVAAYEAAAAAYPADLAAWESADPETRGDQPTAPVTPTVGALATEIGCDNITGDHPFLMTA